MIMFDGIGLLLTLIAIFGYINHRFIKLPDTLGITAVGLIVFTCLSFFGQSHSSMVLKAQSLVEFINFPELVFHGLLGLLLFAGALHIDISKMNKQRLPVFLLATIGVLISTLVVGIAFYVALHLFYNSVSFLWCLVFGALISPTDPIAVLAVLKNAKVSSDLETQIAGEALFNDGTAVVAFMTLLSLACGATEFSAINIVISLTQEILGAVILGLIFGYGGAIMIAKLDSYPVEILITLALSTAGYRCAELLHVSAPLSVVVMGLVVGNHGISKLSKDKTSEHLFNFWGLLDELLNLVLFGLIGLEVLALSFKLTDIWIGIIAIPIVLIARYISVVIPMILLKKFHTISTNSVNIMTWGGLRGGISIALALSLPQFEGRDMVVGVTYVVVIFSLLVQATTLGSLVKILEKK